MFSAGLMRSGKILNFSFAFLGTYYVSSEKLNCRSEVRHLPAPVIQELFVSLLQVNNLHIKLYHLKLVQLQKAPFSFSSHFIPLSALGATTPMSTGGYTNRIRLLSVGMVKIISILFQLQKPENVIYFL